MDPADPGPPEGARVLNLVQRVQVSVHARTLRADPLLSGTRRLGASAVWPLDLPPQQNFPKAAGARSMRTQHLRGPKHACTTLIPCRFWTRMSLICPMNSSRSNQSCRSCPAIRSPGRARGQLRGRRWRTRGAAALRRLLTGRPADGDPCGEGARVPLTARITAGFLSLRRDGSDGAPGGGGGGRSRRTWLVFPRWDGVPPRPAHRPSPYPHKHERARTHACLSGRISIE